MPKTCPLGTEHRFMFIAGGAIRRKRNRSTEKDFYYYGENVARCKATPRQPYSIGKRPDSGGGFGKVLSLLHAARRGEGIRTQHIGRTHTGRPDARKQRRPPWRKKNLS